MKFTRTISIERREPGADGLFDIAISTEAPYERWFGIEILSHDPTAVDLTRLADGRHPLLLEHDKRIQIGAVKSARLDSDKVLRGKVKFSRSALGQEIKQDVEDDIRSQISVGYFINEMQEVKREEDGTDTVIRTISGDQFEREMRDLHGESFARSGLAAARGKDEKPPVFVCTKWQPFEASVVAIGADVQAGFGKSAGVDPEPKTQQKAEPPQIIVLEHRKMEHEQKTPAELELDRYKAIDVLATQYAKYIGPNDAADFIRNGRSAESFKDFIIEKIQTKHTDTSAIALGLTPKEIKRYSLGRALVASITGNWAEAGFERECSNAMAKQQGREAEGFLLPPDVFRRDFNVGTASEAGNLVATDLRGDLFVDVLRNNLVMGQLGARILTGLSSNIDLPRKSAGATIGSVTEIGSASETAPTTAKVTLSPKRASAYVEVSKQALLQSAMSLEAMIRDDLVMQCGVHIENQCINGTGTAPQMTGIRYTAGIGTVVGGTGGAAPAWSHFVDLETACAAANAEPDRLSGYLINTKTRGKLKQTQMGTNLPWIWQNSGQPLNGYRAAVSNNLLSNLTKGTSTTVCSSAIFGSDWSMATIGLFGAPDVVVDPYSKADTGQVKITLNQYADFGVRQPACFAKVDDLITG